MKGNAQIESTSLGNCGGAPCLTSFLQLSQGASGQGFGGYALDDVPKERGVGFKREPAWVCGWWITRILETVGVENWEDLKGKFIRVEGEDWGKIAGIGHIIEDKWFFPEKELAELNAKRS